LNSFVAYASMPFPQAASLHIQVFSEPKKKINTTKQYQVRLILLESKRILVPISILYRAFAIFSNILDKWLMGFLFFPLI